MDMIIKSKDKHGNQIEFNPKGKGARYRVNGLKKKGVWFATKKDETYERIYSD